MTTETLRQIINSRGGVWGVGAGMAYGVLIRLGIESGADAPFLVMSLAFIVFVPFAIGYLTVSSATHPSRAYAVLAPWLTCAMSIGATMILGLEGMICVIFGSPIMLVSASLGGLVARETARQPSALRAAVLILPFGVATFESGVPLHDRVATTVTEIDIAAPPDRVWPLVASVDTIRASERRPALFTRIGFPAPIAATLDHEGVGGVRTASFERGVVFHEAVTTWEPGRRLSFTIDATQVPPGALDDHVAVGGPFFDVLTGTYELIPAGDNHTRLRLTSAHRVGTHLNWYASGWVHVVMRSIQGNILQVLKARAEGPAAAQRGPGLTRAPVPGGELEYVDRGQGEPVVFVHGVLMADLLLPLATEPAFAGDRAIVVHRRGYAGTTPAGASWSVAQDAGDLAALLRHLGIPRAHIVAHSAGGVVAMEFAASYPQMTKTLTLLDPPLNFMQAQRLQPRPGGADETEQFLLEKGGPDFRTQLETRLPGALPQVRRDAGRFNAVEWVALGAWSFDAARARRVTAPVLFLSQKHDPMVDTLQRWWPTMQFVEVPGATHMFPFERSAPTAATIAEFVSHYRN